MSILILPAMFISTLFVASTYSVVKSRGGNPAGWVIGMFIAWPVLAFVTAAKYRSKPMLFSVVVADAILVMFMIVFMTNFHAVTLEKRTATNLHELGQALVEYAQQNGGVIPANIIDLTPHLKRRPSGPDLPPALISPHADGSDVVGYRLVIPRTTENGADARGIHLDSLPADARIIEDVYAPPSIRIGVYADGSIRSY